MYRWTACGVSALIGLATCFPAAHLLAAETNPPPAPGAASPKPPETGVKPNDKPGDSTLSEKLDKNEGVLKPPKGIDPEMRVPPDATHDKMPVIVPPGEPGGDQSIQPK